MNSVLPEPPQLSRPSGVKIAAMCSCSHVSLKVSSKIIVNNSWSPVPSWVTQGKLRSQHMLCKRCVMLCLCKRNIIAKSSEITVYLTKMFKLLANAYQGSASLDAAWRLPCPRLHLLVPYGCAPCRGSKATTRAAINSRTGYHDWRTEKGSDEWDWSHASRRQYFGNIDKWQHHIDWLQSSGAKFSGHGSTA